MFLGQVFVKNTKNDPRTLFGRPKSKKSLTIGKTEIAGNTDKWSFSTFETPKLGHFSTYLLAILYKYTPEMVLSHMLRFFENSKLFRFFGK